MRNILGLLIFADPRGIITWKNPEWAPLREFIPFISRWCDTVGHHPDCYLSLIRLLKTIGFNLLPDVGISWLHRCMIRIDNDEVFFERGRIAPSLAELLHDSWAKQEAPIKQNSETFRNFIYLVDKVAGQGERVAIQLQARLQQLDRL